MQLTGTMLLPFVVEMETLLLSALFNPLNEQLCIPQLNVIQVRMPVLLSSAVKASIKVTATKGPARLVLSLPWPNMGLPGCTVHCPVSMRQHDTLTLLGAAALLSRVACREQSMTISALLPIAGQSDSWPGAGSHCHNVWCLQQFVINCG